MATYSVDLPLGTLIPPFTLRDPFGKSYTHRDLMGEKGLLVVFMCNHCPYAQAVWPRLIRLSRWAKEKGVNTVAINPNIHPDYPEDDPEVMKIKIQEWGIPFPYLVDETQEVARSFQAQCTPDPYLFSAEGKLVYHGRIDDNWKDEKLVKKEDLKEAIEHLVQGLPPLSVQHPSMGCSIKWRSS
jgi:peroxiredoxin